MLDAHSGWPAREVHLIVVGAHIQNTNNAVASFLSQEKQSLSALNVLRVGSQSQPQIQACIKIYKCIGNIRTVYHLRRDATRRNRTQQDATRRNKHKKRKVLTS